MKFGWTPAQQRLRAEAEEFVKPITPDSVIDVIDRALPGKRTYVVPGRGTTAMHRMRRFAPTVTNRIFRSIYGL